MRWIIALMAAVMSCTGQAQLPTITGRTVIHREIGRTFTIRYRCSQPSPYWGVGTDGDGSTITGFVPLGNGRYQVTLTQASDWVWISDVPSGKNSNNGCESIQVHFIGR